jgi:hypothetical protein
MTTVSGKKDAAAIIASASRAPKPPPISFQNDDKKAVWCETQWTSLSLQAKRLDLPSLPYFDPETMLLSKEINHKLWAQLVGEEPHSAFFSFFSHHHLLLLTAMQGRLWDYLGPDRAPYAAPVMVEGGEVKWHSFLNRDKGIEVEVYGNIVDAFMSNAHRPGHYG